MNENDVFEKLLALLLPFAKDTLKKYREFYPFGAVVQADGSLAKTIPPITSEHPDSTEVLQSIAGIHKAQAEQGKIVTSAIVYNATVCNQKGKPVDAIIITIEHWDSTVWVFVQPYKIGLFKKVTFDELSKTSGTPRIFI